MRDAPPIGALETYLARLEAALTLPTAEERQEIVLETRSHVVEQTRRTPFRSVNEVLAELGPPEEYARQFLSEQPPARRPDALRGIARLASGWTKMPLLLFVVSAYAIAVLALVIAVSKLTEPEATGLWIYYVDGVRRSVSFVLSDPNQRGREVLGYTLVPLALLVAVGIHLVMSALLRRVVRDDIRSP